MSDTLGIIICFAYIFLIIGLAEGLRRWRGYGSDFTRKVIHIGVGMLSWALPFLFTSPWPFVFACVVFMVINLIDWRYGLIGSMQSKHRGNLGTVYFPLAAAVVALIFWDQPPLMVAALMPLTYGAQLYMDEVHHEALDGSEDPDPNSPDNRSSIPFLNYQGPFNEVDGTVGLLNRDQPTLERPGTTYDGRTVYSQTLRSSTAPTSPVRCPEA